MCDTVSASLLTFAYSAACMGWLWTRPRRTVAQAWMALVVVTFATFQLADAALWYALGHPALNRFVSATVLPVLLAAVLWVNHGCARWLAGWRRPVFECQLAVFSVAMVVAWGRWCVATTVANSGHLRWCELADAPLTTAVVGSRLAYVIMLAVPFLAAYPAGTLRGVALATLCLTFAHALPRPDFGARWCWSANALSLLAVVAHLGDRGPA